MNDDIIQVKNVSYFYKADALEKPVPALNNISLNIKKGDFVCIIGRNGSGKSTLARLLNGILVPSAGSIIVDGLDTSDESKLFDIRKSCAMVFQNPDNQIVATVVEEDVAFGLENMGVPSAEIRRRVDEALKTVRMSEYAKNAPHLLSGGQKQRVAIAGVFAMNPKCIVLDEPTSMLDPEGRAEVMDTIKRLNEQSGITIILITHNMYEVCLSNRAIVMKNGSIVMDDAPYSIFSREKELKDAGLEIPQTSELLMKLKMENPNVRLDAITADQCANELKRIINL